MKKLLTLTAITLISLTSNAQKKDTTVNQPAKFIEKITDSLPLVSIQDMNRYLSGIDPKTLTVYELELLKKAFQGLVDIGIKNFATKQKN